MEYYVTLYIDEDGCLYLLPITPLQINGDLSRKIKISKQIKEPCANDVSGKAIKE